jgi:hypothetical protein
LVQCQRCGIELRPGHEGLYCYPCQAEVDWKLKTKQLFKRTCRGCGDEFLSNIPNKLYCGDKCKKEAEKEVSRKTSQKYYENNKKRLNVEQLGTTSLGPHRRKNFEDEERVIKNTIKKTSVRGVYKGKYSYAKKSMKLTANDHPIGQYGIQLTHNYGTLDDYHKTGLNLILNQKTRKCPDCNQTETNKDTQHAEIQCSTCGLVLMGPYDLRIKYPFMEYPTPPEEPEDIDPNSWYPKPEGYRRNGGFDTISFDTTPIKVICSRCKSSNIIPFNAKKEGCPECGGHYMGVGICLPHDFNDEFAPPRTENNLNYDLRATEDRGIGE